MVSNNIKNSTSLPIQNQKLNQTKNSDNIYQQNQIKTFSTNLYGISQPQQNLRINEAQLIIKKNTWYAMKNCINNLVH